MFSVSSAKGDGRSSSPGDDRGVLVNLPRTRPQRASPRRAAARKTASARRRAAQGAQEPAAKRDAAPKQGFESDGENMSGPVQPPGGTELVASAVELVGELAKAGLSTGERVLKDVLSRLPRS
jgi:hypothetical protein